MNGCSFQQVLRENLGSFLFQPWKTLFLRDFILKPSERALILLKNGTRDFQNNPPFERPACFYVTISGNFERFQYLNFETNFLENENLFPKKLEYRFLVESTKIGNASFPYKTVISEAYVKTNRMVRTKWTHYKERSFVSNEKHQYPYFS